jgi:hypothetical protein
MKRITQILNCRSANLGFRGFLTVLVTVCSVLVAEGVSAPLAPGSSVFPPPDTSFNPPNGTLLATTTTPFLSASLSGSLISRVYSGDTTSPFSGGLTFTYQISLNLSSPDSISQLSISRFGSFLTDVSVIGGEPTNDPPSFISRSIEAGGTGDVLQFHFGPPGGSGYPFLMPGSVSALLIVQTSAANFQPTTASIIDGVAVPNIVSLAPLSVPEPTTAVLGLVGLVAFALVRRKK